MTLRVQFWGTRGSIPSPGRRTVRYGGNTPCLEIRTESGWLVVLDAGTGIRELGLSLQERSDGASLEGDIFLTHAHWDHIQGLPFFAPMFQRGNHFTIWGSKALAGSLDRVLRDQMSPVVFPVAFEELAARIDFSSIAAGERRTGRGYDVLAFDVQHPGGALGYRFGTPGGAGSIVYVSDNEVGAPEKYKSPPGWRAAFLEFVRGASVLVHDTMYTTEEYEYHRGWGHSTYQDAVDLALDAGVGTLVLFHHEPRRSDDELDQRIDECRTLVRSRGGALQVLGAAEGMTLTA